MTGMGKHKTVELKVGQKWMTTPWEESGAVVEITALELGWVQYRHEDAVSETRALKEDAFRVYYGFEKGKK